jgi:hypothetical protein
VFFFYELYAIIFAIEGSSMKRLVFVIALCLLAGMSNADFEIKDPASQDEALSGEEQMHTIGEGSAKNAGKSIRLAKRDYLELIVGNHVHGFKAFDTLVNASDDSVFVGIFYGTDEKEKANAEQFADYLRKELPVILGNPEYKWAKGVDITVTVYGEDRY